MKITGQAGIKVMYHNFFHDLRASPVELGNSTGCNAVSFNDFRYNEEMVLQKAILIDFQMVSWVSPVLDLTYLLSASTTGQVTVPDLTLSR